MTNHLKYLVILILALSCKGLEKQRISSEPQIITEKYQSVDTLHWKVIYTEYFNTCLGLNSGIMQLGKVKDEFVFTHIPPSSDTDIAIFKGKDENLIDLLIDFETKAKTPDLNDRHQTVDSTYRVKLYVNEELTEFSFSKRQYNGIEELISEIQKLEIKN